MVRQITLTLSDTALKRATELASLISRPVEDVLAETIEVSLPDLGGATALPPIMSLSDEEIAAFTHAQMESKQNKRFSDLLDLQQRGVLTDNERLELHGLYQTYLRLWLRQSEALAEATRRGLGKLISV